MLAIPEFVTVMTDKVLPAAVESLKKCQTVEDVGLWRKSIIKDLCSK